MSELAKYIDHTFLKPNGDADAVKKLCREAKKYGFASVCVNPAEVALAAKLLKKSETKVVNLPNKLFEEIAPKYENRNGGYTRIVKIGQRKGDGAMEVLLELI